MAQLSDDCFAFGGDLLSIAAALDLLDANLVPVVEPETVPLKAARGRILAAPRCSWMRAQRRAVAIITSEAPASRWRQLSLPSWSGSKL